MSLTEILPDVQALPRHEKLRLIRYLADDLEKSEEAGVVPGQSYPIWSPREAFSAADAMLKTLQTIDEPL